MGSSPQSKTKHSVIPYSFVLFPIHMLLWGFGTFGRLSSFENYTLWSSVLINVLTDFKQPKCKKKWPKSPEEVHFNASTPIKSVSYTLGLKRPFCINCTGTLYAQQEGVQGIFTSWRASPSPSALRPPFLSHLHAFKSRPRLFHYLLFLLFNSQIFFFFLFVCAISQLQKGLQKHILSNLSLSALYLE